MGTRRRLTLSAIAATAVVGTALPVWAFVSLSSTASPAAFTAGKLTAISGLGSTHPNTTGAQQSAVHLTWTGSPTTGVTGYTVQRAPITAGACGTYADLPLGTGLAASATSFDDVTTAYNTQYCYKVVTLDNSWKAESV